MAGLRRIKTKKEGKCEKCGTILPIGTEVNWYPGTGKVYGLACHPDTRTAKEKEKFAPKKEKSKKAPKYDDVVKELLSDDRFASLLRQVFSKK